MFIVLLRSFYHEVGVGNVLRNHSWNIGGYLENAETNVYNDGECSDNYDENGDDGECSDDNYDDNGDDNGDYLFKTCIWNILCLSLKKNAKL
jgi:hypothetical protein